MDEIRTIENYEWQWVFFVSALLLLFIVVPYIWAFGVAASGEQFIGILIQPIDGISYLAKMYQGYEGNWMFHLPYTPEPHREVFVYTLYLSLGHLARFLNLPLDITFHVVRLLASLIMFLAIYRFVADWTFDVTQRRITWLLALLASGFGSVAVLFGQQTSDLLGIPEAFPLQAAYTNVHFPLAIALTALLAHVLLEVACDPEQPTPTLNLNSTFLATGTIALVSIAPFALVPLGGGYGLLLLALWRERGKFPLREVSWGTVILIFGIPLGAYSLWAVSNQNPVLAAWMAQNQTPSPPVWDYLTAFGPLLILAGIGIRGVRQSLEAGHTFLLGWLATGALLLYMPFGLQRRFTIGLILPLVVFAGIGLWRVLVPGVASRRRLLVIVTVFAVVIPTTIISIVLPMPGALVVQQRVENNFYFISDAEVDALEWVRDHSEDNPIVLASQPISLNVPMYDGRVVYAHPFETNHAQERQAAVGDFYSGVDCDVLTDENVSYVFWGKRERAMNQGEDTLCIDDLTPAFTSSDGSVVVYDTTSE